MTVEHVVVDALDTQRIKGELQDLAATAMAVVDALKEAKLLLPPTAAFKVAYEDWCRDRTLLSAQEDSGDADSDDWHDSDDVGIDLLRAAAELLGIEAAPHTPACVKANDRSATELCICAEEAPDG